MYCPGLQVVQAVDPVLLLNVVAGHTRHMAELEALVTFWYVPAAHAMQLAREAALVSVL